MSEAQTGGNVWSAVCHDSGGVAPGATAWLSLAAAPTFAVMAVLTGVFGGDMPDVLCLPAQGASPLSGMTLMYLLMSAFHSAPWLKLVSSRERGGMGSQ